MNDPEDPCTGCRFHWLPFTLVYWLAAGAVSFVVGSVWILLGAWLATPVAIFAAWRVFIVYHARRR